MRVNPQSLPTCSFLFLLCLYLPVLSQIPTSLKYLMFVDESMAGKPVTELAGIGEELGKNLSDKGFNKSSIILGQFLVQDMNEKLFKDGLNKTC